jgi:hypothetical protein
MLSAFPHHAGLRISLLSELNNIRSAPWFIARIQHRRLIEVYTTAK